MTSTALMRPLRMGVGALEDPERLGTLLAASGYFQDARDAAQAVVKVLAGAELGFGPIASMTGVYIVKSRVTLSANLQAAAIRRSRVYDFRVRTLTNDVCEIVFLDTGASCPTCAGAGLLPDGQASKVCRECMGTGKFPLGVSEFTTEDAKTAQLLGGENWKKYPRNMLFARAMSNGAKLFCPDVFAGAPVYTPDELGAEIDPETGELLNYAAPAPTPMPAPSLQRTPDEILGRDVVPETTDVQAAQTAPVPKPVPKPTPEPEPRHDDPAPTPEEPTPEPLPDEAVPAEDPDAPMTPEEATKLTEYLHRIGTPETMWRLALVTNGAKTLADLTKGQAHELMARAKARYSAEITADA